jgi:hypothetical protein
MLEATDIYGFSVNISICYHKKRTIRKKAYFASFPKSLWARRLSSRSSLTPAAHVSPFSRLKILKRELGFAAITLGDMFRSDLKRCISEAKNLNSFSTIMLFNPGDHT